MNSERHSITSRLLGSSFFCMRPRSRSYQIDEAEARVQTLKKTLSGLEGENAMLRAREAVFTRGDLILMSSPWGYHNWITLLFRIQAQVLCLILWTVWKSPNCILNFAGVDVAENVLRLVRLHQAGLSRQAVDLHHSEMQRQVSTDT